MHEHRTHNCSELNKDYINQQVKLSGWVHRKRDHGNLLFLDLRDNYGITQLVITPEVAFLEEVSRISYESVITIVGKVVKRSDETINQDLQTGEIEIVVEEFFVNSEAKTLPLQVNLEREFPEETRLKYRFLDLRREKIHNNIILRSQIIKSIRQRMQDQGFNEFQTPILTASSPEGARDYLVPSRIHPGKFYALPQAPQQFKQLLMCAGFDKYFQIAPCFRDEDARADRSPGEFYQLDVEMSFVTQDDVFSTMEPIIYGLFKEFSDKKISKPPFKRIPYEESMLKYGSDKPDLRNPIIIHDVSTIFLDSGFSIFSKIVSQGNFIRAIPIPNIGDKPRSFFDKVIEYAQGLGAPGLGYIIFKEDGSGKGPIAKFLDEERINNLKKITNIDTNGAIFFSSGTEEEASSIAGAVRKYLAEEMDLINKDEFSFCWIVDFPYFEWDIDNKKIDFSHNPFSMPQGGIKALDSAKTTEELLSIKAWQYDIVCNGIELSSGAIRNHLPSLMYKAFDICGYSKEEVDKDFGGMIRALQYGAPPHGGIAPGIDRIVMLLAEETNIREIIAFPMNQKAEDLLMGAPSVVDPIRLRELNIRIPKRDNKDNKDNKDLNNKDTD